MKPFFSVIIPALNEEQYIGKLLSGLKDQSFKDFEVIVVDAMSKDKTREVANSFRADLKLQIVSITQKNVSLSRNKGADLALGKYLFFVDADNSVDKFFLENTNKIIHEKKADMIIPAVIPDKKNATYMAIYSLMNILGFVFKTLNLGFSTGGNLVIDAEKFKKLGGFNKDIFIGEDQDLVRRTIKAKLKSAFLNDSKIIFSTRRLEKEKLSLVGKYFVASLYISLFGKITRKIYNYQMGGHYFKKSNKNNNE